MPKPNYVSVRIEAVRTSKACQQAEHDTRSRPPSYLKTDVNAETYVWCLKKTATMRGDPEALKAKNNLNDTRRANVREIIKQSAREQQERYQSNVKRKQIVIGSSEALSPLAQKECLRRTLVKKQKISLLIG